MPSLYSFLKYFLKCKEIFSRSEKFSPEVGGGAAGVEELLAGILPCHVGEVKVALNIHSQPGGVDGLQGTVCALKIFC